MYVPAVAVIRRGLALFRMIGRKEFVGCVLGYFKIFIYLNI